MSRRNLSIRCKPPTFGEFYSPTRNYTTLMERTCKSALEEHDQGPDNIGSTGILKSPWPRKGLNICLVWPENWNANALIPRPRSAPRSSVCIHTWHVICTCCTSILPYYSWLGKSPFLLVEGRTISSIHTRLSRSGYLHLSALWRLLVRKVNS